MPPSQTVSAVQTMRRVSFETATLFALLATIIVAGVAFIPNNAVPFVATKAFIIAIGTIATLAVFILARLSRGNVVLPPPLLLGALWLPTLAYALSTVFTGTNLSRALFGSGFSADTLGFMAIMSLIGTLAALAFRRLEHYQSLFTTAFWFAALVLVLQIAAVLVGQVSPGIVSPSLPLLGSVVDTAAFAGLAVIGVLLTLRLLAVEGRAYIALLVLAGLALFVLALFNAQLEWIIVALVSLGLFVEAVMHRSPSGNDSDLEGISVVSEADTGGDVGGHSLVAPLVVLAISLFFILGGNVSNLLANALNVSVLDVRPSWQSTLDVGRQVYSSSPVFGSGPTSFVEEWLKYRDAALNQTVFWNIDFGSGIGFIPTSMITTGLLGALAWLLLLAALLYQGVRGVVLKVTNDPQLRYATILSLVASLYLIAVATASNAGIITLALLFISVGVFASVLRYAPGKTQWGIIFARSPRIGFVIVFVLTIVLLASIAGAYGIVGRYLADLSTLRASTALASGNVGAARTAADSSISLAPSPEAYRLQARIAQAEMTRIANDTSLPAATAQQGFQQELASGITAAVNATRIAPDEYQNWSVLGDLYATVVPLNVEGAYDNALSAYQKAEALNPTSPALPYFIAQLEIASGKSSPAREALTRSITLKQDYTPAIFLLSQLEVASGNVAEALRAAEAAAYFTPSDPGVLFQVGVLRAATGDTAGAIAALSAATAADSQFANAHYFLSALYAKQRDFQKATAELELIAAINAANAAAVKPLIDELAEGKNPFPANLLTISPPTL